MFQYASILMNRRLHFDTFYLLLVSFRLAFSSCVTALFLLGVFVCFEVYLVLIG
jgi:hypothetical protein